MNVMWSVLFFVSLTGLLLMLFRRKGASQWLGYMALNIAVAAVLLYVLNLVGAQFAFRIPIIPINEATVLTVGLLGVPGLLLLSALKLTMFR